MLYSRWLKLEQSQTDHDGFTDAFQGQVIYNAKTPNQPEPVHHGADLRVGSSAVR
jgi:hypothetical protein